MSSDWQTLFAKDATLFPHLADLAKGQLLLSTMSEEGFRQASFLDQRIMTPSLARQVVQWADAEAVELAGAWPKPQYIFHIGHVGSTLISRLLGELEPVLALREPAILRQFAELLVNPAQNLEWSDQQWLDKLRLVERWLSRAFRQGQGVMIKASSFVSPLAEPLLANGGTALVLTATLERYLQTILAGDASKQEAAALADIRLQRLARHCGAPLAQKQTLSLAQTAALGWLCEMVTLASADAVSGKARIGWMDFDDFLRDPSSQLQVAAGHFGLELSASRAEQLISSPIMSRYSKAPEYDYSPSLREDLLAEAAKNHADDIQQTLLWGEALAKQHPKIAAAYQKSESRS